MSDRHEARVLLAVLARSWDEAERLVRRQSLDAARFVALARRCDVPATVHRRLEAAARLDLVGSEAATELGALRRATRRDNILLLARLEQALDVLLAEGIRPVALKGADALHRLYDEFDERNLDDVDLLVPKAQRDRALDALQRAGWRGPEGTERTHWLRSSFEMPLKSPGPIPVDFDIHWSLGQTRRYAISAETVLARAVPLDIAGRSVLRLEDHDAVAHLLIHHVQHYFDRRLKWVLDLGLLARAPGFSWTAVRERLLEWGGSGAAGLALLHVRKLFPELLDPAAYRAIPVDRWRAAFTLPLRATHPLDLFRGTRRRRVQLWLAAAALEHPSELVGYLRHRATRDARPEAE